MQFGLKIIKGLFWGQIGMAGRTVICFVISIVLARSLGVANYGLYVVLLSFVSLLLRATAMGVSSIYNTYIPRLKNQNQIAECSFVTRKIALIRFFFFLFSVVVIYLLADPLIAFLGEPAIHDYLLLTLLWFLIRGCEEIFCFIVMANMDMKQFTFVEMTTSILELVGILVLSYMGIRIDYLLCFLIGVHLIKLMGFMRGSIKTIKPKPVSINLAPIFKFGLTIWLASILQYLIKKEIDIFMILYFLKDRDGVAYYAVAYLLSVTAGSMLLVVIENLTLPILSEAHTRYGMKGLRDAWLLLTKTSIYLSAPVLVFIIAHADEIVRIFYTDAYLEASFPMVIFSGFTLIGICLANEVSLKVLFPLNKERLVLYLQAISGVLNVILNLVLIPKYGIMGAVFGTGGAFLFGSIIELIIALKIMKARLPFGFMLKIASILVVSISWTCLFSDMNMIQLIGIALVYWIMVTFLLFRFYRFSEHEKAIIREFNTKGYDFLTRFNLLR